MPLRAHDKPARIIGFVFAEAQSACFSPNLFSDQQLAFILAIRELALFCMIDRLPRSIPTRVRVANGMVEYSDGGIME